MELRPQTEKRLPSSVYVAIIGGGIAGLSLARALADVQKRQETKVSVAVFEKRSGNTSQDKFYLGGDYVTSYGKLAQAYLTSQKNIPAVPKISGVNYYSSGRTSHGLEALVNIAHLPNKGYTPIPQSILERSLINGAGDDDVLKNIYFDTKINTLETNGPNTIIRTTRGMVMSRIVIDCTGMNQAILEMNRRVTKDYKVCGTYGGITSVRGIKSNYLYFIRGLPSNSSNGIFPIKVYDSGIHTNAEVVVANDMDRSGLNAWYRSADQIFEDMQRLYETIDISIASPKNMHNGGFRLEPSIKDDFERLVFPYGESAGMNSPEHGQLADILPVYSHALAEIVLNASTESLENVGLRFYDYWKKHPPFSYLLHSILRENRQIPPQTAILLKQAMLKAFTPDEMWEILQKSGMKTEQILKLFTGAPLEMLAWSMANIPIATKVIFVRPDLIL